MAQNIDLQKTLAEALQHLHNNTIALQLVTRRCESTPREKGDTINVSVPPVLNFPVQLNIQREAQVTIVDGQKMRLDDFSMEVESAISSLAEDVEQYILGLYRGSRGVLPFAKDTDETTNYDGSKGKNTGTGTLGTFDPVYLATGTAGTIPFGGNGDGIKEAKEVSRLMANARGSDKVIVVNLSAESRAQDIPFAMDINTVREGQSNQKLGFRWYRSQNVLRHRTKDCGTVKVNKRGGLKCGDTCTPWDGEGAIAVAGDLFTFEGGSEYYAVAFADDTKITFAPALKRTVKNDALLTFEKSHTVNLAWDPKAIVFVSCQRESSTASQLGTPMKSMVDGDFALNLEVTREHKQTTWAFDILFGGAILQPELVCRLMGE